MAGSLSLDDKLLGEKMHYYCSSSDDENDASKEAPKCLSKDAQSFPGNVNRTGPKGVLEDWRQYKKLESESRAEQEKELLALQTKLSLTCRSHLNDVEEKHEDEQFLEELETLDDVFMKEYRFRRLEEMKKFFKDIPTYEGLLDLDSVDEFLEATDKSHPLTPVVIHLYELGLDACHTMNECLEILSKQYTRVKFCKMQAHKVKLSSKFSEEGVPALLVYKGGELVGNLVALRDSLGDDFFAEQVEQILLMHGLLPAVTPSALH